MREREKEVPYKLFMDFVVYVKEMMYDSLHDWHEEGEGGENTQCEWIEGIQEIVRKINDSHH